MKVDAAELRSLEGRNVRTEILSLFAPHTNLLWLSHVQIPPKQHVFHVKKVQLAAEIPTLTHFLTGV